MKITFPNPAPRCDDFESDDTYFERGYHIRTKDLSLLDTDRRYVLDGNYCVNCGGHRKAKIHREPAEIEIELDDRLGVMLKAGHEVPPYSTFGEEYTMPPGLYKLGNVGHPWRLFAAAPISRTRDSGNLDDVNYAVACKMLGEIEGDAQYWDDVRHGHWAVGWVEQIYFDPTHEPTAKLILEIVEALENGACLDDDALAEANNDEVAQWVKDERGWYAPWAGDIETGRIVEEILQRDDYFGPESVRGEWITEAIEWILSGEHHDFEVQPDQDDPERCKCGELRDARLHRDKEFEQIPGQLTLC